MLRLVVGGRGAAAGKKPLSRARLSVHFVVGVPLEAHNKISRGKGLQCVKAKFEMVVSESAACC